MWGNEITSRIISYYSEYYAKQERSKFKVDISEYIVGGDYGLNILLYDKPKPTDMPVIYSSNPSKDGKELTNKIYNKYNTENSETKAEVPEILSIDARNNNMRDIIANSVKYLNMREVLPGKSYEICDFNRAIIEVNYDPTKGYNSIVKGGQKLISPVLFLIDALRKYSNPNNYDEESRRDLQARIRNILEHINFDIYYAEFKQDKSIEYNTNKFPKSIVEYFMKYVHVISTETTSMFIINKSAAEFIQEDARDFGKYMTIKEIKSYTIDLLNDYFLEKVVIRYSKPAPQRKEFNNKEKHHNRNRHKRRNGGKYNGRYSDSSSDSDGNSISSSSRGNSSSSNNDRDSSRGSSSSSDSSSDSSSSSSITDSNSDTECKIKEVDDEESDKQKEIEGGYDISCKYIFYTQGYYEVIPFSNEKGIRQAIPSIVLQYTLLEDNSGLTLVYNGIMKFYNYLFSKEYIKTALEEHLPGLQDFYGTFRNKSTLKKKLIKTNKKSNFKYFPSIDTNTDDVL